MHIDFEKNFQAILMKEHDYPLVSKYSPKVVSARRVGYENVLEESTMDEASKNVIRAYVRLVEQTSHP